MSKRLRVTGQVGKVTGRFSNFRFPDAYKIELHIFREAGTFIGVDGEMHRLLAYFDHPADYHLTLKMASAQVVEMSVVNNSPSQDSTESFR